MNLVELYRQAQGVKSFGVSDELWRSYCTLLEENSSWRVRYAGLLIIEHFNPHRFYSLEHTLHKLWENDPKKLRLFYRRLNAMRKYLDP